jgi:hypothetical protein
MFTNHVAKQLGYYVYRLIDPRNGETFYVGKGKGNRVFAHVRGESSAGADELTEKLSRIRQIRVDGFEVAHVIHRHDMTEDQALEVEAALIDAFPEVTNEVGGRGSDDRGLMHAQQVIERYEAPEAMFAHRAILINVGRTATERESIYAAVRYAWTIDARKAAKADVVLAVMQGLVVGVFVAEKWLPATVENFPGTIELVDRRWGFVGREAPPELAGLYLRRRVPSDLRGARNPIRYVGPWEGRPD